MLTTDIGIKWLEMLQPMNDMALPRRESTALEACVAAAPVMIWCGGVGRRCSYFNGQWLNYRGRVLEDEIGVGWTQGVHPDDLKRCLEAYESSFFERRPFQVDFRLQRHDSSYRWVFDSGVPWFSQKGVFMGYIGCCVDVQDRKANEQSLESSVAALQRQNEDLMQFAYGASHDLLEPMRTVASYSQLLAKRFESESDPGALELLELIVGGVRRMQDLITELLKYSLLLRNLETPFTNLDCEVLFEEALSACQAAAKEANAEISHGPLPTVQGDRVQLVQVLQNLLSNAIKYRNPQEPPRIHVSAKSEAEKWVFEVADNGIGFEAQYAERIFGLFKRLHGGEYHGSGLGLGICKKIIERHDGRIWANSEPGKGSQFYFTLPRI